MISSFLNRLIIGSTSSLKQTIKNYLFEYQFMKESGIINRYTLVLLIIVISVTILYFYINQKHYESVPSDLKIVAYTDCSLSFRAWDSRITIDAAGNGVYEHPVYKEVYREKTSLELIGDRLFGSDIEKKSFQLSEEELLSLLNSIEKSGFYELKGEDSDSTCIYDFCSVLEITKNGFTKKFTNDGCDIKPFDDAEDAIWSITYNKTNSAG
jgi:hypothetical protein